MCVTITITFKYTRCTLLSEGRHLYYNKRVITTTQPSMDQNIVEKLVCSNPKLVYTGHDYVCNDTTEWTGASGSTSIQGRCPQCEEEGRYDGD